jgi:hypothetical protein
MKRILLALCIVFLFCSTGWALDHTVCPSGCDYNTLSGAVEHIKSAHATFSENMTITISGSWSSADSARVSLTGFTLGAYSLTITATGDARHDGTPNKSGAYYNSDIITLQQTAGVDGIVIDGIMANRIGLGWDANTGGTVKNCILYGTDDLIGPIAGNCTGTVNIYNNILFRNSDHHGSADNKAIELSSNITANVYNNTIDTGAANGVYGVGISGGSTNQLLKNNIVGPNTSYRTCYSGTFSSSSDYNTSSDTTSTDGAHDQEQVNVTYANSSSQDFHLASSDTIAKNAGVDLSGTFTTDIDGETRSGTWDIGADEYSSSGTTAAQVIIVEEE